MSSLRPAKLVHVNHLVDDYAGTTGFLVDVCGAREYWRGYDEEQRRDANLMVIGDLCVELFAPVDRTSLLGASVARYGPGWHSFEWQVPDLEEAKAALDERGVRVTTYRPGEFLMAHPGDCHGMLLELCPLEMTGDPRIEPGWTAAPWRDEHPLGVVGLNALSVAVRDLAAASRFVLELVDGAEVVYREARDDVDADAVGVRVAGYVVEFVQARSERGPIAEFVGRWGQRLRSVELGVVDPDRAAQHLVAAGRQVVPGSRKGVVAFDVNGARWEIAAGRQS